MKNHIMVDLETTDTIATASIVSIGAVIFSGARTNETFYRSVDIKSCTDRGLTVNPATMFWWSQQSDEVKSVLNCPKRVSIKTALFDFAEWVDNQGCIWGNGASFDNAILHNAYRSIGHQSPWQFWNDRCYRTVVAGKPKRQQQGIYHNALDDAHSQAHHLLAVAPESVI